MFNLQQLTILTNLQRGNVKTLCRDAVPTHPLSFQEKAAKGSLVESDINGNLHYVFSHFTFTFIKWLQHVEKVVNQFYNTVLRCLQILT